ncbi:MAG: hypothetical protein CSA11_07555 [Chloroflexi bacterium]|nr:MAG: hypothetical protein CSA11_07555 [Chloroflexota bacterium]
MDKQTVSSWRYRAEGGITAVTVSAKHNLIMATTLAKNVIALNTAGEVLWRQPVGNQAWRIGMSDDAQTIVVGTGSTRPWDMTNRGLYCFNAEGKQRWSVNLKASVWGLSVSSAGNTIVAGTEGKQIVVLDNNGQRLLEQTLRGWGWYAWVWSTAVSADGNLIVAGSADKHFRLISRQGKLIAEHKAKADIYAVAVSADGSTVAAGDTKGNIYMTNATGSLLWQHNIGDAIWAAQLSHSGQQLLVGADEKERHLLLFDRSGRMIWRRHMGAQVTSAAISADGNVIMAGTRAGSIHIFNQAGDILHRAQAQKNIRDVALSTDGKMAIAGSYGKHLYAFHLLSTLLPPKPEPNSPQAISKKKQSMVIIDDSRLKRPFPSHIKAVLTAMFATYRKLIVKSEFKEGFSSSRVFLVRPLRQDGRHELPSVVKIDDRDNIEKEWQAYQNCIRNRLPSVAAISGQPVYLPDSRYGGLRYPLAGDGAFETCSLRTYCQQAPISDILRVLEKLFISMGAIWKGKKRCPALHLVTVYDSFLPPNLLLEYMAASSETPVSLKPETRRPETPFARGDTVQLAGFKVIRILYDSQTLILNIPSHLPGTYHLRCQSVPNIDTYVVNQIMPQPLTCQIVETRMGALQQFAADAFAGKMDVTAVSLTCSNNDTLPNPLIALPHLLDQSFDAYTACIHADLHLGNVLVEPQNGNVHLIDFIHANENHVLRDFLNLELAVVTQIAPTGINDPQQIIPFYNNLHCALHHLEHAAPPPEWERPFAILLAIRQAAQHYFFNQNDWREYYTGLIIFLLGSLRYRDLDEIAGAKQIAFWGAAATLNLWEKARLSAN